MSNNIHEEIVGELPDGRSITAFTLSNAYGLRATFLNYGGILVECEVPDKIDMTDDITLGLDDVDAYINANAPYFGAIVGRFANRIAKGKFKLKNKSYTLDKNDNDRQTLHGGSGGFSHQLLTAKTATGPEGPELILSYDSPDGEMGFPGNLHFRVRIWLSPHNGICYAYEATTDAPTVVNFTTHPYFNLAGEATGSIRQHFVQIIADHYLPVDANGIPTGKLESVADGPFDFRQLQSLDQRLDSPNKQVAQAGGFDHTFVFKPQRDPKLPVAVVVDEQSGRKMEVFTTEPGIQFYTGNSLDGTLPGKNGQYYARHAGLCLETQHFPDAPNQPDFPSTTLLPGQKFTSFTEYRFSTV